MADAAQGSAVGAGRSTSRLTRLRTRLRDAGMAATVRKAIGDHVFRRSVSVIMELQTGIRPLGRNEALPEGLRMLTVRAGDEVPPLCGFMAPRHGEFEAMLGDGKIAIFALQNGLAVGCAWLSLTDHRDRKVREHYRVGEHEAYHYCWMIDPALKRTNLALPLMRETLLVLAGLGIKRQFGVIDVENRASYMIHIRFGYQECGAKVTHYRLFGARWTRMGRYRDRLGPPLGRISR